MSTNEERILIHRLVAGELDALEAERARALAQREPDLAELLEQLEDLQARAQLAFPEPPPLGDRRSFVELMRRLSSDPSHAGDPFERAGPRATLPLSSHEEHGSVRRISNELRAMRSAVGDQLVEAETHPGAYLFHLREIQRDDGLPVELELYAGDALAIENEVLLVSAFAESYHPTPGSVLGSIADRFGISLASGLPSSARRYAGGLVHLPDISCPAFSSLWIIELREPGQPFSLEDLRRAMRSIGDRLSDMLTGASSITLPLLGTGRQQLNPRDVARELLSALPEWAKNSRLNKVRIFTLELEHIAVVNRTLDDRDFGVADSALAMARQLLARRIEQNRWPEPVRAALKDLQQIASAPDPSMRSVALEGRRVAEIVLRLIARDPRGQGDLFRDLAAPSGRELEALATSDLQLLLAHGRAAGSGEPVASHDAMMTIYAAMRAADTIASR